MASSDSSFNATGPTVVAFETTSVDTPVYKNSACRSWERRAASMGKALCLPKGTGRRPPRYWAVPERRHPRGVWHQRGVRR